MGRLVVPRSILVLVLTLLSAACADSTLVTAAGGLEPEPIMTVSAVHSLWTRRARRSRHRSKDPPPRPSLLCGQSSPLL